MKFLIIFTFATLLLISHVRSEKPIDISANIISDQSSLTDIQTTETSFGNFSLSFKVYRGQTLKRTLYAYIKAHDKKISTTKKFSFPERYKTYDISTSLEIKDPCISGPLYLQFEGLDIDQKEEIQISCDDVNISQQKDTPTELDPDHSDGKISFNMSFPEEIYSNESFAIRVQVKNPTEELMDIQVWSYIYRSSRSFSGEREQNKKTINLPPYSNITFDLDNKVNAPPGEYSVKLKILFPKNKLPKEMTKTITVIPINTSDRHIDLKPDFVSSNNSHTPKKIISSRKVNSSNSSAVYLSSSAKARRMIPLLIIIALALLLIVLFIRNY
ncbi:hypothetical protein ACFL0V_03290 [Nanoarchaeota archaeon]